KMELSNFGATKKCHAKKDAIPYHMVQIPLPLAASEDLHAWSIYRQNLNSDFTDSALGSSDKSPLPYGNFQLQVIQLYNQYSIIQVLWSQITVGFKYVYVFEIWITSSFPSKCWFSTLTSSWTRSRNAWQCQQWGYWPN
ncbi:hypothetical protein EVAR_74169_1, partial [Eumeta japonica]